MTDLSWVNEVSRGWLAAMGEVSVRVAVLLAAVWLISLGLRKHSAALRHAVWAFSLAAAAVTPLLLSVTPRLEMAAWRSPVPDAGLSSAALEAPSVTVEATGSTTLDDLRIAELDQARGAVAEVEAPAVAAASRSGLPETEAASVSGRSMLLAVWVVGLTFFIARLTLGHIRLRRMARRAKEQPDLGGVTGSLDLSRAVLFLQSSGEPMPMTWGWRRPKILVPASFERWDSDRRSMTLLHELAHVRRSDWLTQTLAQVVRAVFWFHPLVWIAARRVQVEADCACDDMVLRAGSKASRYAEHLVRVARQFRAAGSRPWVAIAMARPSSLDRRVRYVLDEDVNRARLGPRRGLLAALGMMAIALVIPSVEAVPQAAVSPVRAGTPEAEAKPSDWVIAADPVMSAEPVGPAARSLAERLSAPVAKESGPTAAAAEAVETEPTFLAQAQPAPQPRPQSEREQIQMQVVEANQRLEQRMHRRAERDHRPQGPSLSAEALKTASAALRKALRSPDLEVRFEAAQSLGRLESFEEANLETLGTALSDEEPKVQRAVADSLGRLLVLNPEMPPEQAVRWLMPALNASDTQVRREAVAALGRLRGAAAIEAVTKRIDDPDPNVQHEAVKSVGRLLRFADWDAARTALPALARALQHDDPKVRIAVVESLGWLRGIGDEVVPLLARAAEDADPGVQKEAVAALGRIWLVPALDASDTRVRRALGRLRGAAAIEAVTKTMDDTDPNVQRAAVESLGRLLRFADADAARAALPALEKALQHDDPKVRRAVVESLGGLRTIGNEVVPLLARAAEDTDPGVQKEAVAALGRISSRAGIGEGLGGAALGEVYDQLGSAAAWLQEFHVEQYGRLPQR